MKIGYLNIIKENENYVGGIMIADERGIPLEFKYTEPITPTKLQKVLYGEVLEKYLREEIIITNLAGKIENTPDFYIIEDMKNFYFKSIVKEEVILIKATQLKPMKEAVKFIKENEAIIQPEDETPPIRVILHDEQIAKKDDIIKTITEAGKEADLTEPLKRIEEALILICRGEL